MSLRLTLLAVSLAILSTAASSSDVPKDVQEAATKIAGSVLTGPSMSTLRELMDNYGGRLTGSSAYQRSAEWAAAKFRSYGIKNVRLEPFTIPNGWQRGWAQGEMISPIARRLNVESLGWSPSTPSAGVRGEVVVVSDILPEKIKGQASQIKDHIVLLDLQKILAPGVWKVLNRLYASPLLLKEAGAVAIIVPDGTPNNVLNAIDLDWGGRVINLPAAQLGMEDAKLVRRLMDQGPVQLEFEFQNKITGPTQVNNVVAEIPGSQRPDEWIILGAHLDSWDYGTGAQDNGAGSAMVLEAARALSAIDKAPRRSIRFALWGGEEEGLIGSHAYVQAHQSELSKCIAVLNTDNGAGHPKGWKVEGRDDLEKAMEPISRQVLKDFNGEELSTETTYDTDHGPFMLYGVPALDLMVDMSHYGEVHHKSSDTYDKVDPLFFKDDTAILAMTAYVLAQQPDPIAPHIGHAAIAEILKKADLDQFLTEIGVWKP